jgi:hypothetical protein
MLSSISFIVVSAAIALIGFIFPGRHTFYNLLNTSIYTFLVYTLLLVGLYGSTYSIDLTELRKKWGTVVRAVTVGVILKIICIGWLFYLLTLNPLSFLIAVAVAQIDPLSVARLLNQEESVLSAEARAILGAWASFDDPMTVLAALYIASLIPPTSAPEIGLGWNTGLSVYFLGLSSNLAFALIVYLLHRLTRNLEQVEVVLLFGSFAIAVVFQLALGFAMLGLFLRPRLGRLLPFLVNLCLCVSLFVLGMLAARGIDIGQGIHLAMSATLAQAFVGVLLTWSLRRRDRLRLALSQQNGITAIILALLFEQNYPGVVAIVAPAIFFINIGHVVLNIMADIFLTYYRPNAPG